MAENKGPNVGTRLRSLREQQGLSLRALAKRCGLSINAISLIERGENSPTVSTLHRLANALGVPITDLFQEEARQTTAFVKRNHGLRSQSDGITMESLGIGLINQQLEPFLLRIEPGAGNIHDPITHSGEEFVHCLEGEVEYCVGDRVFKLGVGDSLLFDASQPHGCRNSNRRPGTFLLVFKASQDAHLTRQLHMEV